LIGLWGRFYDGFRDGDDHGDDRGGGCDRGG
jgi:hypothetical protein